MDDLDEQILNRITEEEEIEDEHNTELDIWLMRFKEFIDNKFANVTGE